MKSGYGNFGLILMQQKCAYCTSLWENEQIFLRVFLFLFLFCFFLFLFLFVFVFVVFVFVFVFFSTKYNS